MSGPSSSSGSSYSEGGGRCSLFSRSSSAGGPGPGGWRYLSSQSRHCSGPGGVWLERPGAPCGHGGGRRWVTWCCGVLRGQARLCRTCGSPSALAQLALMSINERNHVDQTCESLFSLNCDYATTTKVLAFIWARHSLIWAVFSWSDILHKEGMK